MAQHELREQDLIVVHGEDVRVDEAALEVPVAEVQHRYGGADPAAVVVGALCGVGCLLVLLSAAAAAGSAGVREVSDTTATVVALGVTAVAVLLSALLAGYAAGRFARYDGARNGLLAAVVLVLAVLALVAGAAAFDDVRDLDPDWVDGDLALAAVLAAAGTALLAVLVAPIAGRAGARWHREVDTTLLRTRPGGLPWPAEARP